MKPVKKYPPTIKTGQIWSSAGFKSGFLFSGGAEILNYFFEHLNVLKWKNSKLQSCRSHWALQFIYKNYLHLTSYRRVFYFLKFESHHATKYGAEILYYFFEHLTVLKWKNSKLQSCRSHWELQLWYKKYLHLTPYKKYIIFLIRQALLWCWNFILFFEQLNVPKLKNLKLESYRYHRDLQFLYKNHLHTTSY